MDCSCDYVKYHLLKGEAFNSANPKLVVCTLTRQSRYVHKKKLGFRERPSRWLTQCSAHMSVRVLPLVPDGKKDGEREREG